MQLKFYLKYNLEYILIDILLTYYLDFSVLQRQEKFFKMEIQPEDHLFKFFNLLKNGDLMFFFILKI